MKYIYLFPDSEAMGNYQSECRKFGCEFLGKNKFQGERNLVIRGELSNLKRYAKWLGYELHPDYLYKENEFAGDIEDSCKDADTWKIANQIWEKIKNLPRPDLKIDEEINKFNLSLDEASEVNNILNKKMKYKYDACKDDYKLSYQEESDLERYAKRFDYDWIEVMDGLNFRIKKEGMSPEEAIEDIKETMARGKSLYDSVEDESFKDDDWDFMRKIRELEPQAVLNALKTINKRLYNELKYDYKIASLRALTSSEKEKLLQYIVKNGFQEDACKDAMYINGSLKEFNPREFVERAKQRQENLHTNRIDKSGKVHTIFIDAHGLVEAPSLLYVDIITQDVKGNNQERVLMKRCKDWEEAIQVMENYKRQHMNDSIEDAKELSSSNIDELEEQIKHYKEKHPNWEFSDIKKRGSTYYVEIKDSYEEESIRDNQLKVYRINAYKYDIKNEDWKRCIDFLKSKGVKYFVSDYLDIITDDINVAKQARGILHINQMEIDTPKLRKEYDYLLDSSIQDATLEQEEKLHDILENSWTYKGKNGDEQVWQYTRPGYFPEKVNTLRKIAPDLISYVDILNKTIYIKEPMKYDSCKDETPYQEQYYGLQKEYKTYDSVIKIIKQLKSYKDSKVKDYDPKLLEQLKSIAQEGEKIKSDVDKAYKAYYNVGNYYSWQKLKQENPQKHDLIIRVKEQQEKRVSELANKWDKIINILNRGKEGYPGNFNTLGGSHPRLPDMNEYQEVEARIKSLNKTHGKTPYDYD